MSISNLIRILVLGAIWGGSFLFMRLAAPQFGPIWLVIVRIGGAALFMTLIGLARRAPLNFRHNWRHYMIFGLLNLAIPFTLFAVAAERMNASVLSVVNATAAIWSALIMAVATRTWITMKAGFGLMVGVAGVGLVSGFDISHLSHTDPVPLLAGLGATFCYGLAAWYTKRMGGIEPLVNTWGSMIMATVLLIPLLIWAPPIASLHISLLAGLAASGLALICSGVAFLLYFQLIGAIGPARSMSVVFLIPVFGVTWGVMLLHEPFSFMSLIGAALVLLAMSLITGFNPLSLWRAPQTTSKP